MGQRLGSVRFNGTDINSWSNKPTTPHDKSLRFPDLRYLPPEIGLKILSNVDAQELRRVMNIWYELANDELLWKRLCCMSWGSCTAYKTPVSERGVHFWRDLYNGLEFATTDFNEYPSDMLYSGLETFQSKHILNNDPDDIAEFILSTELLKTQHVVALFKTRYDVFDSFLERHDFSGWFLPIALRSFFFKLSISTKKQSPFIAHLLDAFSTHYCNCNPLFDKDSVLVVVYSLNLLSNDLCNPSIKNKMSKREYIKNTSKALAGSNQQLIDFDYLGHVYDNVYLIGHVAPVRLNSL